MIKEADLTTQMDSADCATGLTPASILFTRQLAPRRARLIIDDGIYPSRVAAWRRADRSRQRITHGLSRSHCRYDRHSDWFAAAHSPRLGLARSVSGRCNHCARSHGAADRL